jgi:predicted transcriptional regulator
MRIMVDIDEQQNLELKRISKGSKRARAALIREAVDEYLARQGKQQLNNGFGLWGERKIDGLAYQKEIRSEW